MKKQLLKSIILATSITSAINAQQAYYHLTGTQMMLPEIITMV